MHGVKLKSEDYEGLRFGKLVIIKLHPPGPRRKALCKCDCGRLKDIRICGLKGGRARSCGCREPKVNLGYVERDKRLVRAYSAMMQRCYNPNTQYYCRYGGRGISVCDEWKNSFSSFYDWSISNGYLSELTIDRIDNDGNYCPENCRWATLVQQAQNKGVRSCSKTGVSGVDYANGKWIVRIQANKKRIRVGTFYDFDAACIARKQAELIYWRP